MKKFGKFLKDAFTKNLGIKFLAVLLAVFTVIIINV